MTKSKQAMPTKSISFANYEMMNFVPDASLLREKIELLLGERGQTGSCLRAGGITLSMVYDGLVAAKEAGVRAVGLPKTRAFKMRRNWGSTREQLRYSKPDALNMASVLLGEYIPVGVLAKLSAGDLTYILQAFES